MERFEETENELKLLVNSINDRIKGTLPYLEGERRKKEIREIENDIDECFAFVGILQDHAALAPSAFSVKMSTKIRNYERNLERFQTRISEQTVATTRKELFRDPLSGLKSDPSRGYVPEKRTALETLDRLNDVTVTIERSNQIANNTEAIGNEIFTDLDQQHQSLARTRDRLTGTQETLSKTKRMIFLIQTKVLSNKIILLFIIFLEILILVGVVYLRFFKKP